MAQINGCSDVFMAMLWFVAFPCFRGLLVTPSKTAHGDDNQLSVGVVNLCKAGAGTLEGWVGGFQRVPEQADVPEATRSQTSHAGPETPG